MGQDSQFSSTWIPFKSWPLGIPNRGDIGGRYYEDDDWELQLGEAMHFKKSGGIEAMPDGQDSSWIDGYPSRSNDDSIPRLQWVADLGTDSWDSWRVIRSSSNQFWYIWCTNNYVNGSILSKTRPLCGGQERNCCQESFFQITPVRMKKQKLYQCLIEIL